jgi:hypothetical protein
MLLAESKKSIAIVALVGIKPPANSQSPAGHKRAQDCELHLVADVSRVPVLHVCSDTSAAAESTNARSGQDARGLDVDLMDLRKDRR